MSAATTFPQTATQTKVVQARNVSKVFKRDAFEVKALDDVSIEIGGGEFRDLALGRCLRGRRDRERDGEDDRERHASSAHLVSS